MHKEEKKEKVLTNDNESDIYSNIKENPLDKKNKRSRWFTVILYPDNSYHMDFLTYIDNAKRLQGITPDFQAFYIYHTAESDEKKNHYHLQLYFANERTVNGVCKMFGVGNYYKDNDVYRAVYNTVGFPDEIEIVEKPNVTPSLCSAISDIHSYWVYLMHRDYASYLKGKKLYNENDFRFINRDCELYKLVSASSENVSSAGSEVEQIINYIKRYHITSMRYLLETLICNDEYKLIKYVEKHTYLVNNLIHYKV